MKNMADFEKDKTVAKVEGVESESPEKNSLEQLAEMGAQVEKRTLEVVTRAKEGARAKIDSGVDAVEGPPGVKEEIRAAVVPVEAKMDEVIAETGQRIEGIMAEVPRTKDLYTPSERKRYEVADDSFSRERARALRDIHHEMERVTGVPLSFSLFGSLVKGKRLNEQLASRNDVDVFIDISMEDFHALSDEQKIEIMNKLEAFAPGANDNKFYKDLHNINPTSYLVFKAAFKGALQQALLERKIVNSVEDIESRLLDLEDITRLIDRAVRYPFEEVDLADRVKIATLFTLSIGKVVKKYREQYLKKLAANPNRAKAEKTWETIRTIVGIVERKNNIPDNLMPYFPDNLEEALMYYGIKKRGAAREGDEELPLAA